MREKREFAKRSGTQETREVLKKFFLVYEGKNTEDIYFDGIADHRNEIGINPLIELVPVVRSYNEKAFCEDEEELEHRIGSRVGLLIEELKS